MSDIVLQRNIGSLIDVKALSTPLSWTAGGAADSVTFTGTSIDREGFSNGSLPKSVNVDVIYSATLGSGNTLAISFEIDSAPDNSTWTPFATEASAVIATGPSGGGVVSGVTRMTLPSAASAGVNLDAAQRYLRTLFVPHLNRAGTDTAIIAALGVFAGFDRLQAPQT